MRRITRSYRILGLPPGASDDEIARAYRDLAQVWHPDRFLHDPRLETKAQDNLKRINQAYEVLRSSDLSDRLPSRLSRLSDSFSAVLGMGDTRKTGDFRPPAVGRGGGFQVLFPEDMTPSRGYATRLGFWAGVGAVLIAVVAAVVFAVT